MDIQKILKGYAMGLAAILAELVFFASALFFNLLAGIFPESASALSSMLSTAATANFIINLFVGITGAFDLWGMRGYAVGFLAGVLTAIVAFGSILNHVAPQVVGGLWGEFLTVLIPIVIVIVITLAYGIWQERQGYTAEW